MWGRHSQVEELMYMDRRDKLDKKEKKRCLVHVIRKTVNHMKKYTFLHICFFIPYIQGTYPFPHPLYNFIGYTICIFEPLVPQFKPLGKIQGFWDVRIWVNLNFMTTSLNFELGFSCSKWVVGLNTSPSFSFFFFFNENFNISNL